MAQSAGWNAVLTQAGVSADDAQVYSDIFTKNNISEEDLADLDRDTLCSIGINRVGDQLKILRLSKVKHDPSLCTVPDNSMYKSPSASASVKLPVVSPQMTLPQFRKFRTDWNVYITITRIPVSERTAHLYSACDSAVQSSAISAKPTFLSLAESVALDLIESLVTKQANPAVHRLSFTKLHQGESECIQDFLVRLRSSVLDCAYACPNCNVDLADSHITDQFILGLRDSSIQTDILTKASQLQTLDAIVQHATAIEAAVRDQSQIVSSSVDSDHVFAARQSQYQREKANHFQRSSNSSQSSHFQRSSNSSRKFQKKPCNGCGSDQHGGFERSTKCPAWGHECEKCGRSNHFSKVCFREELSVNSVNLVAHVKYNPQQDSFTSATDSADLVTATMSPKLSACKSRSATVQLFPDSGASICLAGPQHLDAVNVQLKELIPCNKKVVAVGGSELVCKGWFPSEFVVQGNRTVQPLYICDKIDRIYFSKAACIDVTILPNTFPQPMCSDSPAEELGNIQTKQIPPSLPNRPTQLPFPPVPENIPKLKQFLLDQFADTAFNATAPFPQMNTPPAHIYLKPDAVPVARHSPIPVPYHWKDTIKEGLDRDVERGIIKKVDIGTPVEWCSPMVIVTKKDGTPRRTIDLQKLNEQSMRETHHCSSPFQLASQVPRDTYKTVIDAVDGFHAIPLDEESQKLTVFITEWGRYQYLRMPQGFSAAGDVYTRRYDDIIQSVQNKVKIIDDTLLWSDTIENSFFDAWDYLTLLANNGIVANAVKFEFCQKNVDFAGLTLTANGITPSTSILSAIENFPTPTDITGARSWFGLVNQVSWAYATGPIMKPFRDLIKPNNKFYWDSILEDLFQCSKKKLIEVVREGVEHFDTKRQTCLQTDWCRNGIGYLLLQKHCSCPNVVPTCCPEGWKLVYAGSRFNNSAESRYYPTEGELLAVSWGLQHSRMFTLGCPKLLISVDHKPLLGILNDRELNSILNPRILALKESTFSWNFQIHHNPGKWHRGADALSRNPTLPAPKEPDSTISHVFSAIAVAQLDDVSQNVLTIDHVQNLFRVIKHTKT